MNASDGIQLGVAAVLTLTLGAVLWYAWEARKQAKASTDMAQEMREQRLSADSPYLLIESLGLDSVKFEGPDVNERGQIDIHLAYPARLSYRIINAGRGPAKEISTSVRHPGVLYKGVYKDLLRPGESSTVLIETQDPMAAAIASSFDETPPKGLTSFLRAVGLNESVDTPYDCGVVVTCRDVHDRRFVTYLLLGLICRTDEIAKSVVHREVRTADHRVVLIM